MHEPLLTVFDNNDFDDALSRQTIYSFPKQAFAIGLKRFVCLQFSKCLALNETCLDDVARYTLVVHIDLNMREIYLGAHFSTSFSLSITCVGV